MAALPSPPFPVGEVRFANVQCFEFVPESVLCRREVPVPFILATLPDVLA